MSRAEELLKRQARWQKDRQHLTWPEKLRMAEQVRDSVIALRRGATADRDAEADDPGDQPGSTAKNGG